MNCTQCGGPVPAQAPTCPYCGTQTAAGVWQAHDRARQEQVSQVHAAQAHAMSAAQVKSSATTALVWSIIGGVLFCIPVISVVGIVFGFKARGAAQRARVPVPGGATAAIAVGFGSLVLFVAMMIWFQIDMAALEQRRQDLRAEVEDVIDDEDLEQDTACALVELAFLDDEAVDIASDVGTESVKCPLELELQEDGARASLRGVRLKRSTDVVKVSACLERGAEWTVTRIIADDTTKLDPCDEPSVDETETGAASSDDLEERDQPPARR